jgi:hypothetical protein
MVADGVTFLFQCQLRYGQACHLELIISEYIGGSSQWDPHHAKLIAKSSQLFNFLLHSNEFSTKDRSLNGCLFLKNLVNQSHITEDKKTSARASGPFVPCMVTVTHHADIKVFA